MTLQPYIDEARAYLDRGGAEGSVEEILYTIHKGAKLLERGDGDREGFEHQLYDLLFLLFELAAACDVDLDAAWERGRAMKDLPHLGTPRQTRQEGEGDVRT